MAKVLVIFNNRVAGITFVSIIVLSIVTVYFGFRCKKYSIEENAAFISIRTWGILILAAGYIIHNLGDFLSPTYGPKVELGLESFAHLIILVSFICFIISAQKILSGAMGYWLK